MTVHMVQVALGLIISAGAAGSIWFVNRRIRVSVWCGVVESVAALALIGTVMWRDGSQWGWLPVWILTACAAVVNAVFLRLTERRRRARALADLATLVELDRQRQRQGDEA